MVALSHLFTYFNSRPHGGRQRCFSSFQHFSSISTHALTEGDAIFSDNLAFTSSFQLTPSRRATNFSNASTPNNAFQLTPSRRATNISRSSAGCVGISTHALTEGDPPRDGDTCVLVNISTHALTEGDGKFRQIFLLNRGYAYSISLYFLPHFISLLPQILSFQQKSFKFQVRIFLLFSVHLAFALQNQCVHHVKSRFCTNMFYFVFVLFTQIVKPQTIGLFIYDFF